MKSFILGLFAETVPNQGAPSFSRVATALSVLFSLGWVTYIVIRTHAIPDLGGLTIFNTSLYALNRATAFFGTKTDAK